MLSYELKHEDLAQYSAQLYTLRAQGWDVNETLLFKKERFISAMMAAWRIRGYQPTNGFAMDRIELPHFMPIENGG